MQAPASPEREGEGEYGGGDGGAAAIMGDEKSMVTDGQMVSWRGPVLFFLFFSLFYFVYG